MVLFLKKHQALIVAIASALFLIFAILLLFVIAPRANASYKSVMEVIIGILMLILAGLLGYYAWLCYHDVPNFFLFDRMKHKNMQVEELTFSHINSKMVLFIACVCEKVETLWDNNILDEDRKMGYRGVYRPLLAYKMLYDLSDKNLESYWNCLYNISPATLDSLCNALEEGGAGEIVAPLRHVILNFREDNFDQVKNFINENQVYFRKKMISYVKKNIDQFY